MLSVPREKGEKKGKKGKKKEGKASVRQGNRQNQQKYQGSNPSAEANQTLIKQVLALCTRQSRESTVWTKEGVGNYDLKPVSPMLILLYSEELSLVHCI